MKSLRVRRDINGSRPVKFALLKTVKFPMAMLLLNCHVAFAQVPPTKVVTNSLGKDESAKTSQADRSKKKTLKMGSCERTKDKEVKYRTSRLDARILFDKGDFITAAKIYHSLVEHYKRARNWYPAADNALEEGRSLMRLRDYKAAEKRLRLGFDYLGKSECREESVRAKYTGLIGSCLLQQDKYAESTEMLKSALYALSLTDDSNTLQKAESSENLHLCMAMQGNMLESEKPLRDSIEYYKQLSSPERRKVIRPLLRLAIFLNSRDRFAEAEKVCLEALESEDDWGPNNPEEHARFKCQLAIALSEQPEKHDMMMKSINDALEICDRAEGDNLKWAFSVYKNWTSSLIQEKKYEIAHQFIRRGLELAGKRSFFNEPVCKLISDKAICEIKLGKLSDASDTVDSAFSKNLAGDNPSECILEIESIRAVIFHRQKNFKSEVEALTILYKDQKDKYKTEPDHPLIVTTLRRFGVAFFEMGNLEEADKYFQEALVLDEKKYGKDHLTLAHPIQEIGSTYCVTGRYIKAIPYLLRALAIRDKNGDVSLGDYGFEGNLTELAVVYMAMNDPDKARPFVERLFEFQDKGKGPSPSLDAVTTMQSLASAYFRNGKVEEGNKLLARALALRETEKWRAKPVEDPIKNLNLFMVK